MSGARGDVREVVLGVAAVSHRLDPEALAARLGVDAAAVVDTLFTAVTTERDDAGAPCWVLKPGVRRTQLATPDVRRFVDLAAPAADATERLLRSWLAGERPDALRLLRTDPDAMRRVMSWMSDCAWATPSPALVSAEIARFDMRRSFMAASSSSFVGRRDELRWLQEKLSTGDRVAALEAKGGMGKSALIAQYLLLSGAFRRGGRIALVIDFDDPGLVGFREQTLYVELARQAAIQAPELAPVEQALRQDLEESLRVTFYESGGHEGLESAFDASRSASLFGTLIERLFGSNRQVTIVLDTVERARRISPDHFRRAFDGLRDSLRMAPNASLLISGRGAVDELWIPDDRRLPLGPLDRPTAARLLRRRNVPAEHVELILDHVPATPLTLRLAARAVETLGAGVLQERALLDAVQKARVDGYLQRRMFGHLGDGALCDVARRALLLETITPRRIWDIVGPLMHPAIATELEASDLYNALAKVVDVVRSSGPGERSMVLRPEVAEEIRELALLDDREMVVAVHERAVTVLTGSSEPGDLEELQFHVDALAAILAGAPPPGARITLSELRDSVLSLSASGLYREVVALIESHPAARRDPDLLLRGARAARQAGDVRAAESLASTAVSHGLAPLVAAEVSVIRGWAAAQRGSVELAHTHRLAARAIWDALPPEVGTAVERATLVAELAVDDPDWARATLEDLVAASGTFALRGIDRRLVNRVCSLVRTAPLMSWAATLGTFDTPAPENLDLSRLAYLVYLFHPSALPTGPGIGVATTASSADDATQQLVTAQRAARLGPIINRILGPHTIRGVVDAVFTPTNPPDLLDTLADVLDQLAGAPRQTSTVDIQQRVGQFDALARMLTAKVDGPVWRDLVGELNDARIERRAKVSDVELAVRGSLTEIDRTRQGGAFTSVLLLHGYTAEAALADDLFVKRIKV